MSILHTAYTIISTVAWIMVLALDDAYDSLEHRGALKWNEFTSSQDYNIWPSNENQLLSALKTPTC